MKRSIWKGLALFLLGMALLTACGGGKERRVTGLVTELQTDDNGDLTALVVREGDKEIGILLTEKSYVFPEGNSSGTREELRAAFQAAVRPDIKIQADCPRRKKKLTTGSGNRITAYEADYLRITGRMHRGEVTMQDGTLIDMIEDSGAHTYQLADGTELLRVAAPYGPENSYTGGVEGLDSLTETAQKQVLAYYEQRGLVYDEPAELEKAYALYRKQDGAFAAGWVEQGISPSASGDRVICFLTAVTLPIGEESGQLVYTIELGDAFDRETGKHIDTWDLFTVPKDTVIQTLLEKSGVQDQPLRAEMEAAPWDGRIVFSSGGLSVTFEPGVLPSQEHSSGFSVDYDDIRAMLRDWAIPQNPEQT